ncbi:TPA: sel1 repeat family protein [Pseudomonas aeruginosa]|nr:sel1 repeat family protein [Pseudomonas aeruginosa]
MVDTPPLVNPTDAAEQYSLALRYKDGDGVSKDLGFAWHWFRKSADQGYPAAEFYVGFFLDQGLHVQANAASAMRFYRRSAIQGVKEAQYNLGNLYFNSEVQLAIVWWLQAANQGLLQAEYMLGVSFLRGYGVTRNEGLAAGWFKKAADQGDDRSIKEFNRLSISCIKPKYKNFHSRLDLRALNLDAHMRQEFRKFKVACRDVADSAPAGAAVEVAPCPICNVKIAKHVMKRHITEYHRPEPKIDPHAPRSPLTKKPTGPALPFSSAPAPAPAQAPLESLCPRCGGDGGVRGGCTKCDGTGWVSLAMERDGIYRPDNGIGENSRVSNSDYLGGNGGAHFREIDGRIGTIPSHDDYSEES